MQLRDPQQHAMARLVAPLWVFWIGAVRFPLTAFALGAMLPGHPWLIIAGIVVLLIITLKPALGVVAAILVAPISAAYHAWWLACFMSSLGLALYVEAKASYLYTEKQVDLLNNDLLASPSRYIFHELQLPLQILHGFPSYSFKEALRQRAYARARRLGISPIELATFDTPSIRIFRFTPSDEDRSVGAAVAFPFIRYSSLIFVRHSFETLNDAQRCQLYHELGHGTPEGVEIFLRSWRWRVITPFATLFGLVLLAVVTVAAFRGVRLAGVSLAAFVLATYLRLRTESAARELADAAPEVLADNIALTHSDFAGGKWRERALNLSKRLRDQIAYSRMPGTAAFTYFLRMKWLERWLSLDHIPPYMVVDVDPTSLPAFVLFVVAGYFAAPIPVALWLTIGCWILVARFGVTVGIFGKKSNDLLLQVHRALPHG
jgi:hypothetical protein